MRSKRMEQKMQWSTLDQAWCDLCEAHQSGYGPVVCGTGREAQLNVDGLSVLDYLPLVEFGLATLVECKRMPDGGTGENYIFVFSLSEKGIDQSKRSRKNEDGAEVPVDLLDIVTGLMGVCDEAQQ